MCSKQNVTYKMFKRIIGILSGILFICVLPVFLLTMWLMLLINFVDNWHKNT